jgi:hypothetical protein
VTRQTEPFGKLKHYKNGAFCIDPAGQAMTKQVIESVLKTQALHNDLVFADQAGQGRF